MFECVECGHKATKFNARIENTSNSGISFIVLCPKCYSTRVSYSEDWQVKDDRMPVRILKWLTSKSYRKHLWARNNLTLIRLSKKLGIYYRFTDRSKDKRKKKGGKD